MEKKSEEQIEAFNWSLSAYGGVEKHDNFILESQNSRIKIPQLYKY